MSRAAASPRSNQWWILLVSALLTVGLMLYGWTFYTLPLVDRVEHDQYRSLSPSGMVGQGYGVVAAVLVVLNLAYLIRRRFPRLKLGSMKAWLDGHVLTGLTAGAFALAHSALQARNDLAITTIIALAVVISTGAIGRYLTTLASRNVRQRIEDALDELDQVVPGGSAPLRQKLAVLPPPAAPPGSSFVSGLAHLPAILRAARARQDALLHTGTSPQAEPWVAHVAREAASEVRQIGIRRLMSSWRAFHRFFAILMVAAVLVHAGVAWYYGYRWIFE